MRFTKHNNPRRRSGRKLSRTDADIIASRQMLNDKMRGIEVPLSIYEDLSDKLCGQRKEII